MVATHQDVNASPTVPQAVEQGLGKKPLPTIVYKELKPMVTDLNHGTVKVRSENTAASQGKRIRVACKRCHRRKIRCSGDVGDGQGCDNCQGAQNADCLYMNSDILETKTPEAEFTPSTQTPSHHVFVHQPPANHDGIWSSENRGSLLQGDQAARETMFSERIAELPLFHRPSPYMFTGHGQTNDGASDMAFTERSPLSSAQRIGQGFQDYTSHVSPFRSNDETISAAIDNPAWLFPSVSTSSPSGASTGADSVADQPYGNVATFAYTPTYGGQFTIQNSPLESTLFDGLLYTAPAGLVGPTQPLFPVTV
ncbi:hypothetical protein BDW60DRAFT_201168 [Aspergillus nidulans var. acristatus]